MKAIYSYHPDDPDSVQGMQWHGVKRRGAQSLMFLSSTKSDVNIPANNIHIDLVSPNVGLHILTMFLRYKNGGVVEVRDMFNMYTRGEMVVSNL